MISRSTYGFSIKQNWIAMGRGQGKGTACHLSPYWRACVALPQVLFLPLGWHIRSRSSFRLFSWAHISTRWNRGWECPEGLLTKANTWQRHRELSACCFLESIFELALRRPYYLCFISEENRRVWLK